MKKMAYPCCLAVLVPCTAAFLVGCLSPAPVAQSRAAGVVVAPAPARVESSGFAVDYLNGSVGGALALLFLTMVYGLVKKLANGKAAAPLGGRTPSCYERTRSGGCLLLLVAGCAFGGCSGLSQAPVEAFVAKITDQVVLPAVKQALAAGTERLSMAGSAQGINPTYVVSFEGKWVVGIEGRATIGVEGVAGQLQLSTAAAD